MTKRAKWRVNSVEQYSTIIGSNVLPNHGMSLFDVEQLLETGEATDEYAPTGRHVTVAIPISDINAAMALPTNVEIQTHIREILAWQLEPFGTVSGNIDSDKKEASDTDLQVFFDKVNTTWGGFPIEFFLPETV